MRLHRYSKYILKECLITFVMFNIFNIAFSTGLQIKYISNTNLSSFSIIYMIISIILVIGVIIGLLKSGKM